MCVRSTRRRRPPAKAKSRASEGAAQAYARPARSRRSPRRSVTLRPRAGQSSRMAGHDDDVSPLEGPAQVRGLQTRRPGQLSASSKPEHGPTNRLDHEDRPMIAPDHRRLDRQPAVRGSGRDRSGARRHLGGAHDAGRCAARPVGRAGHHPHQLSRAGAADRREPGHLSAGDDDAVGAGRARRCAAIRSSATATST